MKKYIIASCLCLFKAFLIHAQDAKNLPIIDMHLHALAANDQGPAPIKIDAPFEYFGYNDPKTPYPETFMRVLKTGEWSKKSLTSPLTDDSIRIETIKILKKYNIYGVTSGDINMVRNWHRAAPERIINGLRWRFSEATRKGVNVDSLTKLFKSGEFKVFGEVTIQYEGYSPSDSAFEPYLAMAEALDIPVGIHIGPGPPGVAYLGATRYRASLHSATVLEDALIRHPKLRVYAMHAGWPMLDDMIATLYSHPQLYVDLGLISYAIPQKEFYFYLQRLINAGFEKRIMFGSDNMVWPESIEIAIKRIIDATFLTAEQKRDIFFNNAARFLRLTDVQIKKMSNE
jgi:hypothetical protein